MLNAQILKIPEETSPNDIRDASYAEWLLAVPILREAINVACQQLPGTAMLIEKCTSELSERFKSLAVGSKAQSEQVQMIVDTASYLTLSNGERISLEEFTVLFAKTLNDSIEKILFISKMAISMVYQIDDAIANLGHIESFVGAIQKINRQTNLLALNATIEAARAGDLGKGFGIVASEVKSVSREIDTLANAMQQKTGAVTSSVRAGYEILKEVATTDMSENIMVKERLNNLMQSMIEQNHRFKTILQEAANVSSDISSTISSMIIDMQFQDRASQQIDNALCGLKAVMEFVDKLKGETRESPISSQESYALQREIAEYFLQQFKLGDFRQTFVNGLVTTAIISNATEVGHHNKHKPEGSPNDDVELF